MYKRLLILALTIIMVSAVVNAAEIDANLANELDNLSAGETVSGLVYFKYQADIPTLSQQLKAEHATLAERNRRVILALQDAASQTQPEMASVLESLKSQGKIKSYKLLWITNSFIVEANKAGYEALAAREDLDAIYLDYPIENIIPVSNHESEQMIAGHEEGLTRINAPAVWAQGWTGLGRVVMNIDTGVEGTHPALSARFRGDVNGDGNVNESWFDPYDTHYPTPTDDGGHGTHTMGTICGRTTSGDTIGVAIDAKWIAAGAIDRSGTIPRTVSDAILSFQWAVDPDGNPLTQDNPDAIGNSWGVTTGHGYPNCDQTFWTYIDNCEAAGSAVIFSAGNEGPSPNSLRRPADRGTTPYNCFSVGAVDGSNPSLPIADFSSRGPTDCGPGGQSVIKPEVVAPGVNVRSSYPGGGYTTMSGTSMASPHVTGSIAILRQVNPNLDVDAIKDILLQSATDLGDIGEDNTYGKGVINLLTAVQLAQTGFGSIDGYIRNSTNNNPLPGKVEILNGHISVNANASGYYLLSAPAETTYVFRASYFGFLPQDFSTYITPNDTVSHSFSLSPAPSAVLQGTVMNSSGDPLPGAIVTINSTPLPPDTTDSNGFYHFAAVPSGTTYNVTARADGHSQATLPILVINGATNTLDFQLIPAETFESSNGNYTGSGVWEWGVPSGGSPSAYSGTKCWGTVIGGQYANNAEGTLISHEYSLNDPNARLEFYHWYSMENTWDGGNVSISTNNGTTWTLLTPDGGYPNSNVSALGEAGYTGGSGGWVLAGYNISSYNGSTVKFRWRFASDGSVVDYGWYLDDVVVIGSVPPIPPSISFSPQNFNVTGAPGAIEHRNLTISNGGPGILSYAINTVTNNRLLLNSGREIPINISPTLPSPIGYQKSKGNKPGSITEPLYPPIIQGQGGPDTFGHKWIDSGEPNGPTVSWIDITGPGTAVSLTDDSYAGPFDIGFNFTFYNNTYTQLYISSNGIISFGAGTSSISNSNLPNNAIPNDIIPMFWDDLNPGSGGMIYRYFDSSNQRYIVSFVGVPFYYYWGGTGSLTFQAVLYPSGKIEMNYGTMTPGNASLTSATIGIENSTGTDGLQVVYNAAYMHSNLSIKITAGEWLSALPVSGTVQPGGNAVSDISFDASDLVAGTYTGSINLLSNDPVSPSINIPVTFNVNSAQVPQIELGTASITKTLQEGSQSTENLIVRNVGTMPLIVNFSAVELTLSSNIGGIPAPAKAGKSNNSKAAGQTNSSGDSDIPVIQNTWLFISPAADTIAANDTIIGHVTLNAATLAPGVHTGRIDITSNDPGQPLLHVPVTLTVNSLGAAHINLSAASFTDTVVTGFTHSANLIISNSGTATLHFGIHDNRTWLTELPDTGVVIIASSDTSAITFDATTLTPGAYTGQINVNSDDPTQQLITLPVNLVVREQGGSCVYVGGDVNGSGSTNGLDVTYLVNYFKGGDAPINSCDCPPNGTIYAACDVNASCTVNGLDVTYMVNFFKGGAALAFCPDCPPTGLSILNNDDAKPSGLGK